MGSLTYINKNYTLFLSFQIRLQHSLQNSRDIPLPVVGITSGVYSMEGMDRNKIQERALEAVKLHKEHLSLFSIFDNLDQNHAKRLHVTYEAFYHLLGR